MIVKSIDRIDWCVETKKSPRAERSARRRLVSGLRYGEEGLICGTFHASGQNRSARHA